MVGCISFSISSCHSCKIVQCDSAGSTAQLCKWIPNGTWASTRGAECGGWVTAPRLSDGLTQATKEPAPLISAHLSHHSDLSLERRKGRAKERDREKVKLKCFFTCLSLLLSSTFMIMSFSFTTCFTHIRTRLITSLYFFLCLNYVIWLGIA